MIVNYPEVRVAVEAGLFVGLVPGVIDGEPAVAWLAGRLDHAGRRYAYSRDPNHRAAQSVGMLMEIRRSAAAHGFTPV